MMNNETTRTFAAHDLKPGDMIGRREVFDIIDTLTARVAIVFVDGSRKEVRNWTTQVKVNN